MKAAVLTADGPALVEVDRPRPGPTELLVRVRAASMNRADLLIADGRSHGAQGGVGTRLGLEWAGEVAEAGSAVTGFRPGDRVMCSGSGGFAEWAVADARRAFAVPSPTLDDAHASGLTVALRTAWVALVTTGALQAGQTVLVLGASSATGLMTMQVAREQGAGLVIGTSTDPARRARLAEFGATQVLDSRDPRWAEQVLGLTGGRGVDLVVDFLAGPLVNDSMRATALGGRIVNVGRMAGETGTFDFDLHSLRRIQYLGTTFRTRSADEVGALGAQLMTALGPALAQGRLHLPVDRCLPLDQVAEAYALMRRNQHFGKIVLVPAAPGAPGLAG